MQNIAIVGTGNISNYHIQGFLTFPERCRIVALVSTTPEKAEAIKNKYRLFDAEVFDDHKKLLGRDDIDLVDICTPPYVHAEIAVNALKAGKNVLVEKPMAASLEECDAMLAAAKENNRLLSVVAQNRFSTGYRNLKKILDAGLIGKVLHAQANSFWWRGHSYYDLWWRGTWEKEGGGCTLNHAVHHIDLMAWMMGMPQEVQAVMGNTAHDNAEVEDLSIAILKYKNGSLGQITSSVVHHGEEQQLIFQGEKAKVAAPWSVSSSAPRPNGFPMRNEKIERELEAFYSALPEQKLENHAAQIDDVLRALETGEKPLVDGEQGKNALELITAIYEAASTGRSVRLPLSKDDPFYTAVGLKANVPHFHEKTASVKSFGDSGITLGRNV